MTLVISNDETTNSTPLLFTALSATGRMSPAIVVCLLSRRQVRSSSVDFDDDLAVNLYLDLPFLVLAIIRLFRTGRWEREDMGEGKWGKEGNLEGTGNWETAVGLQRVPPRRRTTRGHKEQRAASGLQRVRLGGEGQIMGHQSESTFHHVQYLLPYRSRRCSLRPPNSDHLKISDTLLSWTLS